ncbi:PPE domain-containing protein [Kitasatospora saccharophila]|uniref:PPE domain-containing protein n=1 Tax=Kitasatospora saccharophila TaxID=407973 RepID=A0ABN2Y1N1_9ACTN
MLTFEAVTEAKLDRVNAAADAWGALRNRYLGLHDQWMQQVVNPMMAGWEGSTAAQAQIRVRRVAEQLNAAAEEAADLAALLNDAESEFRDAQNRLRQLVEEEAPAEQLRITSTGEVVDVQSEPEGAQQAEGWVERQLGRQQAVVLMETRINTVLAQATQADQATAWALAQDPNGAEDHGFNADGFNDLDQAGSAERDLREALDLARKGGKLSPAELARLNVLLEAHQGDPAFAEGFATGLGARGTMEFWRSVNDPAQYGDPFGPRLGGQPPERAETMKKLQASLGETLGTASHSHSQAMDAWKKEMIGIGPERIAGSGYQPMGFQLMGSLMRTGDYDSGFLDDFGTALVDQERSGGEHATDWYSRGLHGSANWDYLAEDGTSADPMAGFSAALGHNPDAATAFLDPGPGGANDHLKYLLEVRKWPLDVGDGMFHASSGPLGPALEAAATGDPAGQADGDRRHTEAQARVAQAALTALDPDAGDEELPNGLQGPIANVLADYVDDTHAAFGGVDDRQPGGATDGSVYTTPDGSAHIAVNQGTLIRVMRGASEDPDAYAVLHTAETRKVSEVLRDIPPGASETQQRDQIQQSAAALSVYDAIRDDVRYDERDDDNDAVEWNAKVVQSVAAVADIPAGPAKDVIDPLTDAWLTSVVNDSKEATDNKALAEVGQRDLEAKGQLKFQIGEWAEQRGDDEDSSYVNVLQREAENTRGTAYTSAIEALRGHS